MSCFPFHKWGQWKAYDWYGYQYPYDCESLKIAISQRRQRRVCKECNKEQDRKVKNG